MTWKRGRFSAGKLLFLRSIRLATLGCAAICCAAGDWGRDSEPDRILRTPVGQHQRRNAHRALVAREPEMHLAISNREELAIGIVGRHSTSMLREFSPGWSSAVEGLR